MTTYYSKIKDKILIKGYKMKSIYVQDITVDDIRAIFFPKSVREKYHYLGITWNIFKEGTENHRLINEFIEYVDSVAKPKWCPRLLLRVLHLFGNDNSVVRVRNWKLHRLHNKLTGGIMIFDIKTKWGTLRVYGTFPEKVYDELDKLEEKINPTLEVY